MIILYILMLSFCCYSAFYYRSAANYLKLTLESEDLEDILERVTDLPQTIGGVLPSKYLEKKQVKTLRTIAILVNGIAFLTPMALNEWWGIIFVFIGGLLAIFKKLNVRHIDKFIYQAKNFLIISIVLTIGILIAINIP